MTSADDPFSDLETQLSEDSSGRADAHERPKQLEAGESADGQESPQDSTQSLETPAFPFDVTTQDALYARSKTWEEFDDLLLEVELALRETGIRDVPKRELHDAALRVLTNHPEDLVDAVVEARR